MTRTRTFVAALVLAAGTASAVVVLVLGQSSSKPQHNYFGYQHGPGPAAK